VISAFPDAVAAALAGLRHTFRTQRNFRVQCALAAGALVAGAILDLSTVEIALVFVMIALVLGAELINTSLESLVDLHTTAWTQTAKATKDAAAAAVLLIAGIAAFVGTLVLFPPALVRIGLPPAGWLRPAAAAAALLVGAIAVWARRGRARRPGGFETVSGRVID